MSLRGKTILGFTLLKPNLNFNKPSRFLRSRPAGILISAGLLALLVPFVSASKKPTASGSQTITGVVIQVTPQQMSIQGDNGNGVTLTTMQDYTEVVAFGSHVTATYVDAGGRDVLQTLKPPLEAAFVEPDEIRGYIHNVILLPETRMAGANTFYDELSDYFRSTFNWYVKPRAMAQEIQSNYTATGSALDSINPETGKFDMARYIGTKGDLVRKIAQETRVDAVIDVSIVSTTANLDARTRIASWDGYKESTSGGGRGLSRLTFIPIKATIPALTISLEIWNAQGKPLWNRRMGFTVLMVQEGMLGKLHPYSLSAALVDQDAVRKWFGLFFRPLLPPGEPSGDNARR